MAPFILAFCLFSAGFVEASEKCYGVALEGGGTRGAYEAGALLALTEFLPVVETSYKIISGISIGAINACACAGFEVGDERNMALHVKDLWNGITSRKLIYSYWFGGLFYRPSVLNNAAELKYIQQYTGPVIKRNITVSATNTTLQFTPILTKLLVQNCYLQLVTPQEHTQEHFHQFISKMNGGAMEQSQRT